MKSTQRWAKLFALTMTAGLMLASRSSGADSVAMPFAADSSSELSSEWTNNLAKGNTAKCEGGVLELRARAATSAHVARAFNHDHVRIACDLKSRALSTPCLISLLWDDSNHLQFGLNGPAEGRLNVREVLGTYPHDRELGMSATDEWQSVGIELASDCIRYLAGRDEDSLKVVYVSPRPKRFAGPPKLLALGQDSAGGAFPRATPWLVEPLTNSVGLSHFRGLRTQPLDQARSQASAAERKEFAARERDRVGEQELASKDDPSFSSVSRHFPEFKWPRETVGVKECPVTIGVAADGSLELSDDIASYKKPSAFFTIDGARFGVGALSCQKQLLNGWMPIVVATANHQGVQWEQTVFGWTEDFSPDKPLRGYVRLQASNSNDVPVRVKLQLCFGSTPNASLDWNLELPPHESRAVTAMVPRNILKSAAVKLPDGEFESKLVEASNRWNRLISEGTRFDIPEKRVQDAYRAWLAFNFLNVAKRNGVFHVCDGSGFYDKVFGYSAALYSNGLDLMGYHALAAKYCDSLLSFMHTNGLLAVNFGDTDTGTALWVMAEHYRMTRDEAWLRGMAPKMRLMCGWIVENRHQVLAKASTEPVVARGLIRYQPYADLMHPAADYFSNAYLWKGLDATASVFAEIGLADEAAALRREADAYLKDIRASMKAAVFKDRDMEILPMIPDTHELWNESNGSANGYYGIIAPCLLETGALEAKDPYAKLVVNALEKRGGLVAGISQFHDMADHAYTYGYWMNCLQRDDVKRAILGLYGSLAFGMTRNTYSAVECTSIRTGENYWMLPHTYSNTQQLRLLRNLLVREEGGVLWLGQAIPRDWLAPGKRVAVTEAPTVFGPVSYALEAKADGSIRVQLTPPTRTPPTQIIIRLREPKQRQISGVKVDGEAKMKFSGDTIRVRELTERVVMNVTFARD